MLGSKAMLPAHPLPGERNGALKGDQYADYKANNGNTYGITGAPKSPMRAVAQWDDHQALLLGWTGSFPATIAAIVKAAKPVIDVYVVHEGSNAKSQFQSALSQNGVSSSGIKYFNMNLNSIWMRDYGPFSVRSPDGTVSFVDARYYHQRVYDDAIPTKIGTQWGINVFRQPLKWEGGTYITDGYGNCYYSQGVYWYGGVSQNKVHQYQKEYLGCDTNIVMKPLEDEGTTHSDMFAKLSSKNTMILGSYKSWQDSGNKGVLDDNEAIVEAATLNDGGKVNVVRIPMPSNSNRQVWRTYANSLYINGTNLVPIYTDETQYQSEALNVWKSVMPSWNHVSVDSTDLIAWSGAVHCITMTVPTGKLEKEQSDPSFLCSNKSSSCFPTNTQGGTCTLNFEGCCNLNTLQQCQNGQVTTVDCGNQGCGWSDTWKAYGCNGIGTGPANAPLACNSECTPNCTGKNCGSDGCGGNCGLCANNQSCLNGQCQNDSTSGDCDGITYQGCCEAKTLKYCDQNKIVSQQCNSCGWDGGKSWYDCGNSGSDPSGTYPKDCPSQCTPSCDGKQCGSDGCGDSCGNCQANQNCNNSGQCIAICTPNCNGKQCGDDGCGANCGTCTGEATCVSGQCQEPAGCGDVTFAGKCEGNTLLWCKEGTLTEFDCASLGNFECKAEPDSNPTSYDCLAVTGPCTPNCTGKSCGSDGCGGACGQCDDGQNCINDNCETPVDPCDGLTFQGCCDGQVLNWCENSTKKELNCGDSGCGWNANGNSGTGWYDCNSSADGPAGFPKDCNGGPACTPQCTDKNCGDDGCDGTCGSCKVTETCNAGGQCVSNCNPSCANKSCGDDGCGGTCGACESGLSCVDGNCVPAACQPKCQSKVCGDDGCSGSCGSCNENQECNKFGECVEKPTTCIPNCNNKMCGDNGCGEPCGVCGKAQLCQNNQCIDNPDAKCGNIPPIGMCEGNILKTCDATGKITEFNCASLNKTCGQKNDGSYDCLNSGTCTPQCEGKLCGDNGCGGTCGSCPKEFNCNTDGQCVSNACVPQCDGRVCGFDGCDGTCGECEEEQSCNPQGACVDNAVECKEGEIVVDNQCVSGTGDGSTGGESTGNTELEATADDGGCTCTSVGQSSKGTTTRGGFILAILFMLGLITLRRQSVILPTRN